MIVNLGLVFFTWMILMAIMILYLRQQIIQNEIAKNP